MTFDELFDNVEENKIENEINNEIAKLIIYAERDWIIEVSSLSDFLRILENEVEGKLSKQNLQLLLKKYHLNTLKFSWKI